MPTTDPLKLHLARRRKRIRRYWRLRLNDPEKLRAKERAKRRRQRERDPIAYRAKLRRKQARRYWRDAEKSRAYNRARYRQKHPKKPKKCTPEYKREYNRMYAKRPEVMARRRELARKYYRKNRALILERLHRWMNTPEGKEKIAEYMANRREKYRRLSEEKREQIRESHRQEYLKNREKYIERAYKQYEGRIQKRREWERKENWILSRLRKMAHDDGMWDLLKQEYDNGRQSL